MNSTPAPVNSSTNTPAVPPPPSIPTLPAALGNPSVNAKPTGEPTHEQLGGRRRRANRKSRRNNMCRSNRKSRRTNRKNRRTTRRNNRR